mgnify:CR=1 FL=1
MADEKVMENYGKEFEELYRAVMLNGNMVKFEAAKTAIDDMMNEIMEDYKCSSIEELAFHLQ